MTGLTCRYMVLPGRCLLFSVNVGCDHMVIFSSFKVKSDCLFQNLEHSLQLSELFVRMNYKPVWRSNQNWKKERNLLCPFCFFFFPKVVVYNVFLFSLPHNCMISALKMKAQPRMLGGAIKVQEGRKKQLLDKRGKKIS